MKHAFLILAHEQPEMLVELIGALNRSDCDVFVHIDAKAPYSQDDLKINKLNNIHFVQRRIDARWGDFSLVEAELELFATALNHGSYDYLHLISGVDYPVNGVEHIINFCELNNGKEFIGFAQNVGKSEIEWRSGRRFLFSREFKTTSILKKILRAIYARLQSIPCLGNKIDREVKKGSQWCSVTRNFAKYVIDNNEWIYKNFRGTYCPDEMVMQTLCYNSSFREHIFDSKDEFHGAMRYIPWEDGILRPLSLDDLPQIYKSEAFFARKFNVNQIHSYGISNNSGL